MRMAFGKHYGLEQSEIPSGYLCWLTRIELRPPLRAAVDHELARREHARGHASDYQQSRANSKSYSSTGVSLALKPADIPLVADLVDCGYKLLAKRHHPDAGGTTQMMEKLNELASSLRVQLKQIRGRS